MYLQNDKTPYASLKPSFEIIYLFDKAKELENIDGINNPEVLERAGRYFVENEDTIDFRSCSKKVQYDTGLEKLPSSFKVRINDVELYEKMQVVMSRAFNITRIMTPFMMRVVLTAYINYLEQPADDRIIKNKDKDSDLRLEAISLILNASQNTLEEVLDVLKQD